MHRETILIAEDDRNLGDILRMYLESNDYDTRVACDGAEAWELFQNENFTLAIVDLMMPVMDGYELIRRIREVSQMPMIILSAKVTEVERVLGLNVGADVYLTKPVQPLELIAYVKSTIRRLRAAEKLKETELDKVLRYGELEIIAAPFSLRKNGVDIELTQIESKLLLTLIRNQGKIMSRKELFEVINGTYIAGDDKTILVHIFNLRSKLESDPKKPVYIRTYRGLGYSFSSPEEEE